MFLRALRELRGKNHTFYETINFKQGCNGIMINADSRIIKGNAKHFIGDEKQAIAAFIPVDISSKILITSNTLILAVKNKRIWE